MNEWINKIINIWYQYYICNGLENYFQIEWLNFIEKLYSTIVDLFCRHKSDNNMNITHVNGLHWFPRSLVSQDIIWYYYALACVY